MGNHNLFTHSIVLLLLSLISSLLSGVHAFVDTIDGGVHFFLVFDTPILENYVWYGQKIDFERYDFIWGASTDLVPSLYTSNPDAIVSKYIPWMRDGDPDRNLTWWKANHPDWVLYRCDQQTPAWLFTDPHIPLDFSNPDVVDWQVKTFAQPALELGYNAIAADNYATGNPSGACGHFAKNGTWIPMYNGNWWDLTYQANALAWLDNFRNKLHALAKKMAFGVNFSLSGAKATDDSVQSVISRVDYICDEAGFTTWGSTRDAEDVWTEVIALMISTQDADKGYFGINQSPAPDQHVSRSDKEWAVGSYLMAKFHKTAMIACTTQWYGRESWMQEYVNMMLGYPLSNMTKSNGVYWRFYSNGLSIVNPTNINVTINLPTTSDFLDADNNIYPAGSSLFMQTSTAKVLAIRGKAASIPVNNNNNINTFIVSDNIEPVSSPLDSNAYKNNVFVYGASTQSISAYKKTGNPTILSYYIPFSSDPDSDLRNLTWWQKYHPDWILYKCDKVTPAFVNGNYSRIPIDFSNNDVINWQMNNLLYDRVQEGYNAIVAGDVSYGNEAGACGIWRHSYWVPLFNGEFWDISYQTAVTTWATTVQANLHAFSSPLLFGVNYGLELGLTASSPLVISLVNATDFIVDTRGYTQSGSGIVDDTTWNSISTFAESVQDAGKYYFSIQRYPTVSAALKNYEIASYLLTSKGKSAIAIYSSNKRTSGTDTLIPASAAPAMGTTGGNRYSTQNVQWRYFANGIVIVNPTANSQTITLPSGSNFMDTNTQYVYAGGSSVSVTPITGLILQYSTAAPSAPTPTPAPPAPTPAPVNPTPSPSQPTAAPSSSGSGSSTPTTPSPSSSGSPSTSGSTPTSGAGQPTSAPTTGDPTTGQPTTPTSSPSQPTGQPGQPTSAPTTGDPTTGQPTTPTSSPSQPTGAPSPSTSGTPTTSTPTTSGSTPTTGEPTSAPTTGEPTTPTSSPGQPTSTPTTSTSTADPTTSGSTSSTNQPTSSPNQPTSAPTTGASTADPGQPTSAPSTDSPTTSPSPSTSDSPSTQSPTTSSPNPNAVNSPPGTPVTNGASSSSVYRAVCLCILSVLLFLC